MKQLSISTISTRNISSSQTSKQSLALSGIISKAQVIGNSRYPNMIAKHGIMQDGIRYLRMGLNNGIAYYWILDMAMIANGGMRTNNRIDQMNMFANETRLDDDGILNYDILRNQTSFAFRQFKNPFIGIYGSILVSAVHPLVHFAGKDNLALLHHVFQGYRQLKFPFVLDVIVQQVFYLLA